MKSLKELYRIGPGPSSSHTLGPQRACLKFKEAFPNATRMQVDLFGSLALTGKGHGTDTIIKKTMEPIVCEVLFHHEEFELPHPNTMKLSAFDAQKTLLGEWTVCSIGGGAIRIIGVEAVSYTHLDVYKRQKMNWMMSAAKRRNAVGK